MTNFTIKIAERIISVEALYAYTKEFCKDYLTDEKPDFFVSINQQDIEDERIRNERQMELDSLTQTDFPDNYIETLALYRKITALLLDSGVLLMHGSAVALNGKAYIFTARSGTGKTTHTSLWIKHIAGSYILNGDKPLLLFKENHVYVCGTPWMGKEGHGVNEILPLGSICFLERSKTNNIEETSFSDAYPNLLSQVHIPEGGHALDVLKLIKKMSSVTFYTLGCNMDKEAAYTSYAAMAGAHHE